MESTRACCTVGGSRPALGCGGPSFTTSPRSSGESPSSSVGTSFDRPDCFVRVVCCLEEEASRKQCARGTSSRQVVVGQVEGRSGNVPIFNSSRCRDPKHRPSGREVQKLRVAVAELTRERDLIKAEKFARKKFVTGTQHGIARVGCRFNECMVIWSGGHSGRVDKVGPRRCHTNEAINDASSSFCGCEHGSMSAVRWCRAVNVLHGCRGVRVGEVCHRPKRCRRGSHIVG